MSPSGLWGAVWFGGHVVDVLTLLVFLIGVGVLALRKAPAARFRAVLLSIAALIHVLEVGSLVVLFELPVTVFDLFDAFDLHDLAWTVIDLHNIGLVAVNAVKWVVLTAAVFVGRSAAPANDQG